MSDEDELTVDQQATLNWFERMVDAYNVMPEEQRRELAEWEKANVNGHIGTSDWPGWMALIGPKP